MQEEVRRRRAEGRDGRRLLHSKRRLRDQRMHARLHPLILFILLDFDPTLLHHIRAVFLFPYVLVKY